MTVCSILQNLYDRREGDKSFFHWFWGRATLWIRNKTHTTSKPSGPCGDATVTTSISLEEPFIGTSSIHYEAARHECLTPLNLLFTIRTPYVTSLPRSPLSLAMLIPFLSRWSKTCLAILPHASFFLLEGDTDVLHGGRSSSFSFRI